MLESRGMTFYPLKLERSLYWALLNGYARYLEFLCRLLWKIASSMSIGTLLFGFLTGFSRQLYVVYHGSHYSTSPSLCLWWFLPSAWSGESMNPSNLSNKLENQYLPLELPPDWMPSLKYHSRCPRVWTQYLRKEIKGILELWESTRALALLPLLCVTPLLGSLGLILTRGFVLLVVKSCQVCQSLGLLRRSRLRGVYGMDQTVNVVLFNSQLHQSSNVLSSMRHTIFGEIIARNCLLLKQLPRRLLRLNQSLTMLPLILVLALLALLRRTLVGLVWESKDLRSLNPVLLPMQGCPEKVCQTPTGKQHPESYPKWDISNTLWLIQPPNLADQMLALLSCSVIVVLDPYHQAAQHLSYPVTRWQALQPWRLLRHPSHVGVNRLHPSLTIVRSETAEILLTPTGTTQVMEASVIRNLDSWQRLRSRQCGVSLPQCHHPPTIHAMGEYLKALTSGTGIMPAPIPRENNLVNVPPLEVHTVRAGITSAQPNEEGVTKQETKLLSLSRLELQDQLHDLVVSSGLPYHPMVSPRTIDFYANGEVSRYIAIGNDILALPSMAVIPRQLQVLLSGLAGTRSLTNQRLDQTIMSSLGQTQLLPVTIATEFASLYLAYMRGLRPNLDTVWARQTQPDNWMAIKDVPALSEGSKVTLGIDLVKYPFSAPGVSTLPPTPRRS